MLYYLPIYYPPAHPTHQLVYVAGPQPSTASGTTPSPTGLSTPPVSPPFEHQPPPSPFALPYPTPLTSSSFNGPSTLVRPPSHVPPHGIPPTPVSTATLPGSSHLAPPRPPLHVHHSAPTGLTDHHNSQYYHHHDPHGSSSSSSSLAPHGVSPTMLSHAELTSRAKIRSDHLATDHDCILSKYEMTMRQQPVQARMCGVGEKCE